MVSLGNGAVWAEIVAAIERDEAARTDAAGSLNAESAGSTIGLDPSTTGPVAPSELPVAPNLGASEEDGGSEGGDAPSDTALAELGTALDAADFAEALASGGIVESTVDANHPPVGGGCPEALAGRAAVVTTYADIIAKACDEALQVPPPAPYVVHPDHYDAAKELMTPNPPSHRGWRRPGRRPR